MLITATLPRVESYTRRWSLDNVGVGESEKIFEMPHELHAVDVWSISTNDINSEITRSVDMPKKHVYRSRNNGL